MDPLFDRAAKDRRHGAAEIERRLVSDLLADLESWTVPALVSGAERLLAGHPAMANLRNLARALVCGDLTASRRWLRRRAALLSELDERLAASAWPLVEDAARVVTLSRSSSVAAVLEGAWRRGWRGETVIFDGLPRGSGEFQRQRLERTMDHLRTPSDSTMSGWLDGNGIRVVVGADALSPHRFVNASGTRRLLELAGEQSVPAVVVADTGKDLPDDEIKRVLASGPEILDEETGRRRPIFEVIPMDLVSTRISE